MHRNDCPAESLSGSTSAATVISMANGSYVLEGSAAGVFPTQQGASVALLQLFNPTLNDHFYT